MADEDEFDQVAIDARPAPAPATRAPITGGGEDISETNYNFGLGLGFSLPPGLALNVRGELNVVANGETSRKFANVNVGVAYKFLNLP